MITIALLNMKGGVGKTTLAVNLAWHLARRDEKRVLVVDLDPQFNASQYLMSFDAWETHRKANGTVADVLLDAGRARMPLKEKKSKYSKKLLAPIEEFSDGSHLFLLPSELDLSRAVKNPQGVEFRLQKALDSWAEDFDYAFVDCAPTDTVLTATALMASDFVLVPMRPDRFSIVGYGLMKRVLESFRTDYPDPKHVQDLGVVFTMVSSTPDSLEKRARVQLAKDAPYVFETEIPESRSYLRSMSRALCSTPGMRGNSLVPASPTS